MLCSITKRSPGNHIINTGCEIDHYLENWDFLLKYCFWIYNHKDFVELDTVQNPFKEGDIVRVTDEFYKYQEEHIDPLTVIEFRVIHIEWPAVYFGTEARDYYLYKDLKKVN